MRDKRLDLEDLTPLGFGRNVDEGASHRSALNASWERHDKLRLIRPEAPVTELGDSDDCLRIAQADAGRDLRSARAGCQVKVGDVGLRVALVEDRDGFNEVL